MVPPRLNPFNWFLPFRGLLRRELLTTLRGRGSIASLVLVMLLTFAVVYFGYPESDTPLTEIASIANGVFFYLSCVLLIASFLFLPAVAAASMAAEREQETFEQLFLTMVSPFAMVLGKMLNSVGLFVLLLIASSPALSVVLFLVGIEIQQAAAVTAVLFCTCIACGAIGVLAGTFHNSVVRATLVGNGMAAVFAVAPFFTPFIIQLAIPLLTGNRSAVVVYGIIIPYTQPFAAIYTILYQASDFYAQTAVYCAIAILLALICLRLARKRIRSFARSGDNSSVIERHFWRRRASAPYMAYRFPDQSNPTYRKEIRSLGKSHRGLPWRSIFMHFFVSFAYASFVRMQSSEPRSDMSYRDILQTIGLYYIPLFLVTILFAGAYAANLFVKERVRGNLDALHLSLLSSWQIVEGKAKAVFFVLLIIVLAQHAGMLPLLLPYAGQSHASDLAVFVAVTVVSQIVCAAYALGQTVLIGTFCRKSTTALMLSYACHIFTFGGLPFIMAVFVRARGNFLYFLSPLVVWIFQLTSTSASSIKPLIGWAIAMNVYFAAGVALVAFAALVYEDFVRHDS